MKTNPQKPERQTKRELHDLQRLMAHAVMRPLARGDVMQKKWIDGRPTKKIAESFIKPNDRLTSFERLEIYNQQYWFRLRNCFYKDYPGLHAILGDRGFERFTRKYLTRHPSQSYTLKNLGSRLVKFIESESRPTMPHQQLMLDMARLEWAHIQAFDNAARPSLNIGDLTGLDASKIRLELQPHLILLKLENDVVDFLIEIKRNAGLRGEASNAMAQNHRLKGTKSAPRLKRKINFVAAHRFRDNVYFKPLQYGQFLLLTALQSGATLETACAKVAGLKVMVDLNETIKNWFSEWAALEWFCSRIGKR